MAKEKVVVAKRGCQCCGTGCIIMGALTPLSVFALYETVGILAAVVAWPAVFALAHVARYATGTTKRYP